MMKKLFIFRIKKSPRSPLYRRWVYCTSLFLLFLIQPAWSELKTKEDNLSGNQIPILLYHRFGPVVADSMTIQTTVFESHLKYLMEHNYTVIPLRQLIDFYLKKGPPPPARSVVIVADDGHKSVYIDMFPLIRKYRIPVTLFLYPSAISNASYAMTWDQLREMKNSGLVDFQSHSFWHPNFIKDKKRLKEAEYEKSVTMQMRKSKEKIEKELNVKVDMFAWPFGLYDEDLIKTAVKWNYRAAFTIERRHTSSRDNIMTLPRYLMTNSDRDKSFEMLLRGNASQRKVIY
jgi:peptidoglycan/xylan/chitin deacetylase (PgdA/CDA1 family)